MIPAKLTNIQLLASDQSVNYNTYSLRTGFGQVSRVSATATVGATVILDVDIEVDGVTQD